MHFMIISRDSFFILWYNWSIVSGHTYIVVARIPTSLEPGLVVRSICTVRQEAGMKGWMMPGILNRHRIAIIQKIISLLFNLISPSKLNTKQVTSENQLNDKNVSNFDHLIILTYKNISCPRCYMWFYGDIDFYAQKIRNHNDKRYELDVLRSPPSLYPHPLSPPSPPVQQHRAVLGRTWKRSRVRRRPRQEVEWQVRKSRTWYSKGKVHTPVYTHSGGASGRSGGEALPASGGAFPECLKGMPWTVEWPPMSGRSEYGDLRCLITA